MQKIILAFSLIMILTISTLGQSVDDLPDANDIEWHPSGNYLAIAGSDGLWLYDEEFSLLWFSDFANIVYMSWSPDGSMMLIYHRIESGDANFSKGITLVEFTDTMEIEKHEILWVGDFEQPLVYSGIIWHPDSTMFAAVNELEDVILIFDLNGAELLSIEAEYNLTYAADWHPQDNILAVEARAEGITLWDSETGEFISLLPYSDEGLLSSGIHFNSDGSWIVAGTVIPASIHVWDTVSGEYVFPPDTSGDVSLVSRTQWHPLEEFLLYESRMAESCRFGGIVLMNTNTWAYEDDIYAPLNSCLYDVELTPDGNFVTALSYDGYLYQWEIGAEFPIQIEGIRFQEIEVQ